MNLKTLTYDKISLIGIFTIIIVFLIPYLYLVTTITSIFFITIFLTIFMNYNLENSIKKCAIIAPVGLIIGTIIEYIIFTILNTSYPLKYFIITLIISIILGILGAIIGYYMNQEIKKFNKDLNYQGKLYLVLGILMIIITFIIAAIYNILTDKILSIPLFIFITTILVGYVRKTQILNIKHVQNPDVELNKHTKKMQKVNRLTKTLAVGIIGYIIGSGIVLIIFGDNIFEALTKDTILIIIFSLIGSVIGFKIRQQTQKQDIKITPILIAMLFIMMGIICTNDLIISLYTLFACIYVGYMMSKSLQRSIITSAITGSISTLIPLLLGAWLISIIDPITTSQIYNLINHIIISTIIGICGGIIGYYLKHETQEKITIITS
ncbi:hypothetical protein [Methanosphaera cuniculi]|uniref:Uncharacterized protein n=1 Tax=Methanosphaera cuniculi TaxID=1077256 RepID=A0A2A2HCL6_9EURY|nr:hypothetical protein [Methanosphaera cuniculi]PAV07169.1 hypothetical protein ASJ82_05705 [Methanosphaera cuniculi]PWL07620.1 hypothetical protein MSCUN_14940 [Methanosphaera cuniculi]